MAITFIGRTQAFSGSSSDITLSLSTPAGIKAGDLMLVFFVSGEGVSGQGTFSLPAGWVQIGSDIGPDGDGNEAHLCYRFYQTADGTSYSFGSTFYPKALMRVYRGVKKLDAFGSGFTSTASTSFTLGALAATQAPNEWYVAFFADDAGPTTSLTNTTGDLVNVTTDNSDYRTLDGDKAIAAIGSTPGAEACSGVSGQWAAVAVTLIPVPTLVFFSGFETGDLSEWASSGGTFSIETTTVNPGGGNYAFQGTLASGGGPSATSPSFTAITEIWFRFYVLFHAISANLSSNMLDLEACGSSRLMVDTDASGNVSLQLWNATTSAAVGSAHAVTSDVWHLIEIHNKISATVGTLEMKIDGALVTSSVGSLNTGSTSVTAVAVSAFNDSGTGSPTGTVYFDDVAASSTGFIGPGFCKAWQPNATTPTDNAWTKSTGTISSCWNTTPFNATTNVSDSTASAKQTGVANVASATDTGATNGPGTIISSDTINAVKIGMVGKTSSTSTDGADSTIFLDSGGTETDTALAAAWTTVDAYKEAILAATPTASLMLPTCQYGVLKTATGTRTHTIEDAWLIADITPVRSGPPPRHKFVPKVPPPWMPKKPSHVHAQARFLVGQAGVPARILKHALALKRRQPAQQRHAQIRPYLLGTVATPHAVPPRLLVHKVRIFIKRQPRVVGSLRKPQKLIQPPAAALGWALREIVRKAHPLKLGKPWKTVKSSFNREQLLGSALLAFAPAKLKRPHRLTLRRPSALIKSSFKKSWLIQPPVSALGIVLHEVIHKARPVRLGKPWKSIKSTFKLSRPIPGAAILLAFTPSKFRRAHSLALRKPSALIKSSFKRPSRLIQPPAAKLGFPSTKLAKRHRLILRGTQKLIKDTFRAPRTLMQAPAVWGIIRRAHPVKLGKPWKVIKFALRASHLQKTAVAALVAFVPRRMRDTHRLLLRKPSALIKSSFKKVWLAQPPVARLGFPPTKLAKRHLLRLLRAPRLIKSTFKRQTWLIQPPAAKLGFPPTRLAKRHPLRLLRPSRLVKSSFKRPLWLIQPPVAKLGVAVRLVLHRQRLVLFARPYRSVKSLFKRPEREAQPSVVGSGFIRIVHKVRQVRLPARRHPVREMRALAQPMVVRFIRRFRRPASARPRWAHLRLRALSAAPVGFHLVRHFRRLRQIVRIQPRQTAQRRFAFAVAFGARLRRIRLLARRISPLARRSSRRFPLSQKPIIAVWVRLRPSRVKHAVNIWIRRWRRWRVFPRPVIDQDTPRVIIYATLDAAVVMSATLDQPWAITMDATLDQAVEIDATLGEI